MSNENRDEADRQQRHAAGMERRLASAEKTLAQAHHRAFNRFLSPFAEAFALIKEVDLGDLPIVESVPGLASLDAGVRSSAVNIAGNLVSIAGGTVSGVAAGAAAGGLTFATVGAFASASTGAAISGLSGAAATSATLAWLGGGSLATGGGGVALGTTILTGIVAAPVVLVTLGALGFVGGKERDKQGAVRETLKQAEKQLQAADTTIYNFERAVSRESRALKGLSDLGVHATQRMRRAVGENTQYTTYGDKQREAVAEAAGLAVAVSAIIASHSVTDAGRLTENAIDAVSAAEKVLKPRTRR